MAIIERPIIIPGAECPRPEPEEKNPKPKVVRWIPDPRYIGFNPPQLVVDGSGRVYEPVIGGEPRQVGKIGPGGSFEPLIIGGFTAK